MSSDTKRILLKVVSIVFIIFGAFSLISAIIAVLGGGIAAAAGATGLGVFVIVAALISCAGGILEFVAGVMGLKGNYEKGRSIGIILLCLAVLGFVTSGFNISWENIVAILLPVLYLVGIK